MNRRAIVLIFGMVLILSLISCLSTADEVPGFQIYLQGSGSSITGGANGTMVLTVQDTIPYGVILQNDTRLQPLDSLIPMIKGSINAAVIRNGSEGEITSVVQISNPVYSKDTNIFTLNVTPLEFYEGTVLKGFTRADQNLTSDQIGKVLQTEIYLEMNREVPDNAHPPLVW